MLGCHSTYQNSRISSSWQKFTSRSFWNLAIFTFLTISASPWEYKIIFRSPAESHWNKRWKASQKGFLEFTAIYVNFYYHCWRLLWMLNSLIHFWRFLFSRACMSNIDSMNRIEGRMIALVYEKKSSKFIAASVCVSALSF